MRDLALEFATKKANGEDPPTALEIIDVELNGVEIQLAGKVNSTGHAFSYEWKVGRDKLEVYIDMYAKPPRWQWSCRVSKTTNPKYWVKSSSMENYQNKEEAIAGLDRFLKSIDWKPVAPFIF